MGRLHDVALAAAGRMRIRLAGELEPITAKRRIPTGRLPLKVDDPITVDLYPGRFGEASLERLSSRTPAVWVAFLRTSGGAAPNGDGTHSVEAQYAAVILARPLDGDRGADAVAEAIGSALLAWTPGERWSLADLSDADAERHNIPDGVRDLAGVDAAERVDLRNDFDDGLAERRLARWTLTWRQGVTVGTPETPGEIDGPAKELYATPRLDPWPPGGTEKVSPR